MAETSNSLPVATGPRGLGRQSAGRKLVFPAILLGAGIGLWALMHSLILFLLFSSAGVALAGLILLGMALSRKAMNAPKIEAPGDQLAPGLKRALSRAQYQEKTETWGEHGSNLYRDTLKKYQFILNTLVSRFDPSELAYGRYQQACENVLKAIFDQLRAASDLMAAAALASTDTAGEAAPKIEALLAAAERAVGELDRIAMSLAELQTQTSGVDLERALKQLEELAARAPQYSATSSASTRVPEEGN